ncbi:MAG: hypothetical protein PWP23_106 [Candidatus Sumerlaeota bacterium]|nr:hypothetical protein [Candidatus Sumerlaeota bacterium]
MTQQQSDSERRRSARYRIALDCMVSLLIPHQTFTPHSIRGVTVDIAGEGMRLKTYSLTKKDFLDLIKGMSHVKIDIDDPFSEHPISLRGRVVWADYHDKTENDNPHCFLGISFYEFTPQAQRDFHDVMSRIERSSTTVEKIKGIKLH